MTQNDTRPDLEAGIAANRLAADTPLAATWRGEDVVIVRHEGKVCALAGKCTHLGAPMEKGIVADGELRCPFHHARFSLSSGEATAAPAFDPLERYEVREEDGMVRVIGKTDTATRNDAGTGTSPGRVVIVGGGAAGHACAEMLTRRGHGASVTVLSADGDAPYDRTACSKAYLAGQKDRADLSLPLPAGAGDLRTSTRVVRILPEEQAVELEDASRIEYDRLILATGAEPGRPDFDGSDADNAFTLRTLADADRLIDAAKSAKSAVVLGSSYIGMEVAASLIQRGLDVHVVSADTVPLEKTVGPEMGAEIRALHADKGVRFHMKRSIARWDEDGATLDDGTQIAAEMLVLGTGVSPRIDLAKAAGLTLADEETGGLAVNARLQTSRSEIYAIGDIAAFPDPRLGHAIRVEHWAFAQRMGQWLARHLTGEEDKDFSALPFFWSGQYDMNLRYIGHVDAPGDRQVEGDPAKRNAAVFFRENGVDQALLTCGRDVLSLDVEAAWEKR